MILDMGDHLVFRLDHEAEAPAIPGCSGHGADGQGSHIPERGQAAGAVLQFLQAALAPDQVSVLFMRGLPECVGHRGVAAEQRLALIKRLSTDFARMIDPHQASGFASFLSAERRIRNAVVGMWSDGLAGIGHERAERLLRVDQGPVEPAVVANRLHAQNLAPCRVRGKRGGAPPVLCVTASARHCGVGSGLG